MSLLLMTLCMLMQLERPTVRHAKPLADGVEFAVSAERLSYYVGEPLTLRVTLRNTRQGPIKGYFDLDPAGTGLEILYRKGTSGFEKIGRPTPGGDIIQRPTVLEAGSEVSREIRLAFDHSRKRLVFWEPGLYEVKAVYRDMPNDPNSLLESNAITIQVAAPSGQDKAALDSFSRDLVLLSEFDAGHSHAGPEIIKAAVEFLERFPVGPYSGYVREGLHSALHYKVARNRATKEERELYERLKLERPPSR